MALGLPPLATSLRLDLREDVFQARVVEASRWHGWTFAYHPLRSKGSTAGWPDLVLGRPRRSASTRVALPLPELAGGAQVLFAELKSEKGRATTAQLDVLGLLHDAGCTVALWRPSDWHEILAVLAGRATPTWPPRR